VPRLALKIGSRTLTRDFKSWDELVASKNRIKPFATFDGSTRTWVLRLDRCRSDDCAEAISEVFGIDKEEVVKIVSEAEEQEIEKLIERVRGKPLIIAINRLSDEEFRKLTTFARYVGSRTFELDPEKPVKRLGASAANEAGLFVDWVIGCSKLVADPDALMEYARRVREKVAELLTVVAEPIEKGEKQKRVWIRLRFPQGIRIPSEVLDLLKETKEVPYYVTRIVEGSKTVEPRPFKTSFVNLREKYIDVAPFLFPDLVKLLQEKGFRVEIKGFELPRTDPIVPVSKQPSLYPFQQEALQKWLDNGSRGAIVLPTGGGKTYVALGAIARLRVPTIIFVPSANLAYQWQEKIAEVLGVPEEAIGILGAGHHDIGKPILVCIYDSGVERAWELAQRYSLYVFDEGHHVAAKTFRLIAWHSMAPARMVLTATIERDDENHRMIYRMCGDVVYSRTYDELVKEGYVAPVRIAVVKVPFDAETKRKYLEMLRECSDALKELSELKNSVKSEAESRGLDPATYIKEVGGELYKKYRELASKVNSLTARMRNEEGRNPLKNKVAVELAFRAVSRGRRTFVFTNFVKQAEEIYEELRRRLGDRVAIITGQTPPAERERIFKAFREGEIGCIVTTTVLDEGVDAPAADTAIIVSSRAIKHPRQFVQRIGRIVRKGAGKVSEVYILRTWEGNFERKTVDKLVSVLEKTYRQQIGVFDVEELLGRAGERGAEERRGESEASAEEQKHQQPSSVVQLVIRIVGLPSKSGRIPVLIYEDFNKATRYSIDPARILRARELYIASGGEERIFRIVDYATSNTGYDLYRRSQEFAKKLEKLAREIKETETIVGVVEKPLDRAGFTYYKIVVELNVRTKRVVASYYLCDIDECEPEPRRTEVIDPLRARAAEKSIV